MSREDRLLTLYLNLRSSLARAVTRLVPPREVEDIVQETYVRVCQIERSGGEIDEPRAFMYKVARNLALDHLKRADNRLVDGLDEEGSPTTTREWELFADQTFEQAASDEEFSLFCKAVRNLPQQCRRVFVLKKVYGFSQREIASQLNISENTVEKHVATGIKRCTYFMQQHGLTAKPENRDTGKHQTGQQSNIKEQRSQTMAASRRRGNHE